MGHTLGLDLGQAQDYSALAAIEKEGVGHEAKYTLGVLKRAELGTPYPAVVAKVRDLLLSGPYAKGDVRLIVDGTGVGRPVVEMLQDALKEEIKKALVRITPVLITGGDEERWESWSWRVPKRDLLGNLVVLFQQQRLQIPETLPGKEKLIEELLSVGRKITDTGRDVYGAWREGEHDDMVLALALACWGGEKFDREMVTSFRRVQRWQKLR